MYRATAAIPFALVLAMASPSRASQESQAREARKACLAGDVTKGMNILTDLYLDSRNVVYIYNQGRCLEQNHRYEDAISRFREYLLKGTDQSPADRSDAEQHIARCEAYLGKKDTPVSAPQPGPVVPPAPQAPAQPVAARPTAPTSEPTVSGRLPARSSQGSSGFALRIAGVAVAGVGIAALITGVVLNVKANSMSDDLQKLYVPSTDSSRKTYKTVGWTSYGVGAACAVGGAVMYYFGWHAGGESSAGVAIAPAAAPHMVGATLSGAF